MSQFNDNLAVITTRFVVCEHSFISTVVHDDDGVWQFLGSESPLKEEDAMIVGLGEILEIDASLESILDLPENSKAFRPSIDSPWSISKCE